MFAFLQCVAAAVREKGLRGLAGLVPLGESLYDIASDAFKRWRDQKRLDKQQEAVRQEFELAAQMKLDEFEDKMREIAEETLPNESPAIQETLTQFLTLIPERIRQTFSRNEDPAGNTVPTFWALNRPEDVIPLLPARLPRFKKGDTPPNNTNWELVERLGIGGFGEVWKARHKREEDRFAAFKFCLNPQAQERLLKHEARIIKRVQNEVNHPGIVKLEQADFNDTAPWLRYEYVTGGDLTQMKWPKDPAKRVRLATDTVIALAKIVGYCHELNPPIVHRDLKPRNILVNWQATTRVQYKITDFGIGDIIAEQSMSDVHRQTRSGMSISTPSIIRASFTPMYASPQQQHGEPSDPRDDVHALAVIWFQLLIGNTSRPMGKDYRDDLADAGLSSELIDLLARCASERAERRPKDASEMMELMRQLSNHWAGEDIRSEEWPVPPSFPHELAKRTPKQLDATPEQNEMPTKSRLRSGDDAPRRHSRRGLIIGGIIGAQALIAIVVVIWISSSRPKKPLPHETAHIIEPVAKKSTGGFSPPKQDSKRNVVPPKAAPKTVVAVIDKGNGEKFELKVPLPSSESEPKERPKVEPEPGPTPKVELEPVPPKKEPRPEPKVEPKVVKKAPDKADDATKLDALIKDLKSRDIKVKISAIQSIGAMGREAYDAGAALVEYGMMNLNSKVRDAAFGAFEKIDPIVYKEVSRIILEPPENFSLKRNAVEALKKMSTAAKNATPVLRHYFQYCASIESRASSEGKFALSVLETLLAVSPDDALGSNAVLVVIAGPDEVDFEFGGTTRVRALKLLDKIQADKKKVCTALLNGLAASKSNRALIVTEIGKLRSDAVAALPVLKQLKLDTDDAVREAAAVAIAAIRN